MYTDYWQMVQKPFEDGADPEFYYPGESHQAALLKLRYAVENRRAAALLAGDSGLGKSMLVESLKRHVPAQISPLIHLVFPKLTPRELLAYLAVEFGGDPGACGGSMDTSVRTIENALRENVRAGRHAVIAVDEAHLLDEVDGLEFVRLLLNFQVDSRPAMTVILVGQPALLPALAREPALEERLTVKCLLRPLNLEETISYVTHRLRAAGTDRAIFRNNALETLFYLTQGVPRLINRLCDLALLVGFAEGLPAISAEQLEAVCQELVSVTPD